VLALQKHQEQCRFLEYMIPKPMQAAPKRCDGELTHVRNLRWSWKEWRLRSQLEGLDHPMHHRAPVVGVVDGDAVVPGAVPAVGAEEAVRDVAQEHVAPVPALRLDDRPRDGVLLRVVVHALDDALPVVVERRGVVRGGEVAAVGGAVEEDEGDAVADDPVHPPRRVQRRAHRAQEDARPVLVGVEVPAAHAAPQADVGAVGEPLHRGGRAGSFFSALLWAGRRGGGQERRKRSRAAQRRCLLRRFRLGAEAEAGILKAQVVCWLQVPPVD
jgi:hypothetical protein